MGSGELKYWEISAGGKTGSVCLDASAATATATGLQCGLIDVHDDTVFTQLLAEDVNTGTGFDFRVQNQLSGVTRKAGLLWPGYGRYFVTIEISSGQVSYYEKADD